MRCTLRGSSIARRAPASVRKAHSMHDGDAEEDESFEGHQELLQPQRRGAGAPERCREGQGDPIGNRQCPTSWTSRRPRPSPGLRARAVLLRARGGRELRARRIGHRRERRGGRSRMVRGEPLRIPMGSRPPLARDGNSPAPSVGFTTPAHGLRTAHAGPDPADTPRRSTPTAVRRAIPPRWRGHERRPRGGRSVPDLTSRRSILSERVLDENSLFGKRASLDRVSPPSPTLSSSRVLADALIGGAARRGRGLTP